MAFNVWPLLVKREVHNRLEHLCYDNDPTFLFDDKFILNFCILIKKNNRY